MRRTITGAALAALIAAGGFAGPAAAQDAQYGEQQLQAFAEAVVAVEAVRMSYAPQFQEAEDDATRQQIADRAQTEMIDAVRNQEGISLETYNEIAGAAQQDQDLARRISTMVREAAADAQSGGGMGGQTQ